MRGDEMKLIYNFAKRSTALAGAALAVCVFAVLFVSCGTKTKPGIASNCLCGAFEAEIRVEKEDFSFEGTLFASERSENGGERDLTFVFSAPEGLQGVTASRSGGNISLSLDGIEIGGENGVFDGVLAFSSLFDFDMTGAEVRADGDFTLVTSEDGEYTVRLLCDRGVPVTAQKNAGEKLTCEFKSFKAQ